MGSPFFRFLHREERQHMKKAKQHILCALIGASGGLAGMLSLSRCSGNCTACFGCAGVGLGIVLILIGQKIRGVKEESDGMG